MLAKIWNILPFCVFTFPVRQPRIVCIMDEKREIVEIGSPSVAENLDVLRLELKDMSTKEMQSNFQDVPKMATSLSDIGK